MSLTPSAYEARKWRDLSRLRSILSETPLNDHHYGYSSTIYNKFESVSDLYQIVLLVLDNMEKIDKSVETLDEMSRLSDELRNISNYFSFLADELRNHSRK